VWLVVILSCCLNLVALGSVETINSIFGITAPALDCSYMAVVALRLYYADYLGLKIVRKGPFSLGKYQKPINYIALAWTAFVTVVLFFPTANPVTLQNMNYAVVVAAGIAVFALSWWWLGARKTYVGPRVEDHDMSG
jgi:amino acid transporter